MLVSFGGNALGFMRYMLRVVYRMCKRVTKRLNPVRAIGV